MTEDLTRPRPQEWPTLALLAVTYATWMAGTSLWSEMGFWALIPVALAITQYSSLQHEVLHGHPFRNQTLNEALVFPALTLFVPYQRFKATHLQHHHDPALTDPFDDPESNYQDPAVWARMSAALRALLRANNTLLGRMVLGPVISTWSFLHDDIARARRGETGIARAWGLNALGLVPMLAWGAGPGDMPLWAYVIAAWAGYGLLKIRTYLEHRAHTAFRARTVIVEDRGPLALLFLNNNLHVVHHMHPKVPWYELPRLYAARGDHYRRRNEAYVYRSYAEVFARHFLRAKDPVPHPVWPVRKTDLADMDVTGCSAATVSDVALQPTETGLGT